MIKVYVHSLIYSQLVIFKPRPPLVVSVKERFMTSEVLRQGALACPFFSW